MIIGRPRGNVPRPYWRSLKSTLISDLHPEQKPMIPANHLTALIRHFQASDDSLELDGLYGPNTAKALDAYIKENTPKAVGLQAVWESALLDVGKGGYPGKNNQGPYVDSLRVECGFPTHKTDGTPEDGPWCAVGISAHLLRAGIMIRSRGAYRLVETLIAHDKGFEVAPSLSGSRGNPHMYAGEVYVAVKKRKGWDRKGSAHVRLIKPISTSRIDYIEFNGKGDKVRVGAMSWADFRDDLLLVAGWRS